MQKRSSTVKRETKETAIDLTLNVDGQGKCECDLEIPFFTHMLELLVYHAQFDLSLQGSGDVKEVDAHHTVEDVGICLGQALKEALGDKAGIARYGTAYVPMEETLALSVLDICNRPFLQYNVDVGKAKTGDYDVELSEEFLRAFAVNAGITLHVNLLYGRNLHHINEAIFKSLGLALRKAVSRGTNGKQIPSTKGVL